jgi:hypothetical protein
MTLKCEERRNRLLFSCHYYVSHIKQHELECQDSASTNINSGHLKSSSVQNQKCSYNSFSTSESINNRRYQSDYLTDFIQKPMYECVKQKWAETAEDISNMTLY